jgi:zinc-ribbon domain
VKQCKQCGANLPDESRFCLQCGTPVQLEPSTKQNAAQELDFIQPALAGGMFLGFFSSLPLISAGNALCCMWVLLGGGIGVVLLTRQRPSGITYGDGAFVGVLSGLFGAIVGTVVQIPVQIISARLFQSEQQRFEEWFRQLGLEGPMRDWLLRMASGEISVGTVLFTFFANLLMWSLFAMIGGILTVAILRKRAQTMRGQTP